MTEIEALRQEVADLRAEVERIKHTKIVDYAAERDLFRRNAQVIQQIVAERLRQSTQYREALRK